MMGFGNTIKEGIGVCKYFEKNKLILIYCSHSAGVTAILPVNEHVFTGSYDDKLRLFRRGEYMRHICEWNLEGGVWRLVLLSESDERIILLCCCMQAGVRMVTIELLGDLPSAKIGPLFCDKTEKSPLYYAADFLGESKEHIVASSFYEKNIYIMQTKNLLPQ